ncbi:probable aspartic proteinase GIP2 [Mercurialis annua]|uniref:probable aspartic proteinase GIP2 n=1 Tax=Mercurialis annua TaxID=3986 RepID=UPI00215EBD84|nr:probable aspartic proteinase GIP2 [Mercurialis annua]
MASLQIFLPLLFILNLLSVHAQIQIPVTKDPSTLQYLTQIKISQIPTNLVIDLSGSFLWLDCKNFHRRIIPSCSIECSMAKPGKNSCNKLSSCDLLTENVITQLLKTGVLTESKLTLRSVSNSGRNINSGDFLFACAPNSLLNGLPSGVQGMLGLGRTPIALTSQLASAFDFPKKFSTCFSSSNGVILFGNVGSDSVSDPELLRSLTYTPLVKNPDGNSQEYLIKVNSVKIGGKRLEGIIGTTKISSVVPYTILESSIYEEFIKVYLKDAKAMNLTKVPPVSPFGLCFSSKGVEKSKLGPVVPVIDLVLQSEMVKWRFHGRNSMVEVNDEVMCLGVLDGGLGLKNSIVIGGFQLEDTLLEFDLSTSMLGFSLPLLMRNNSCSNLLLDSMVESL